MSAIRSRHAVVTDPSLEPLENRRLFAVLAMLSTPTLVDSVTSDGTPPSALNLRQELEQTLGHVVKPFSGIDAASLTTALAGTDALVIPDLAKGALVGSLTNAAQNVIRSYITGGGGLIIAGNTGARASTLISTLFQFPAISPSGAYYGQMDWDATYRSAAATGTAFAGGPLTIRDSSGAFVLGDLASSVPTAKTLYADPNNEFHSNGALLTTVAAFPYANRFPIVFLGRTWANGGPNGTEDNGWSNVLGRGVKQVARGASPTPAAPSNLAAVVAGTNQLNVSWRDNSGNETGFVVERSTSSTFAAGVVSASVAANTTSLALTGLSAGTTYYVRVRAVNGATTSAPSSPATATTPKVFDLAATGKLTVSGTGGADPVRLTLSGTTLTARVGTVSQAFSNSAITSILVQAFDGDDLVTVGPGVRGVRIEGGAGNDTLIGGANADSIFGQAGNDVLIGGAGADSLDGGEGNDLFYALDGVRDSINGNTGTDTLYGDASDVRQLVEDVLV